MGLPHGEERSTRAVESGDAAPLPLGSAAASAAGCGAGPRRIWDRLVTPALAGTTHAQRARASGLPGTTSPGGRDAREPQRRDDELVRVEALVHLAQGGDAEAFGALYERSADIVFRYVLGRVADRQLAEDLTAETFLRALYRLETFHFRGTDITAWFVTIARNLIADHAKSAWSRLEVPVPDLQDSDLVAVDQTEEQVLRREQEAGLLVALRLLTADQAECLALRFLLGLSLAETATALGRSEGAVKQLQLRGLTALRRRLASLA